jgi:hypothetical protein
MTKRNNTRQFLAYLITYSYSWGTNYSSNESLVSFSPSFCSNFHADRAVHLQETAVRPSHWKCWALFFCLFYAVSLRPGKYSLAVVTVQPVWGTKKRTHLCCVLSQFTVINSNCYQQQLVITL